VRALGVQCSEDHVSRWERGVVAPSVVAFAALLVVLRVKASDLVVLGIEQEMKVDDDETVDDHYHDYCAGEVAVLAGGEC